MKNWDKLHILITRPSHQAQGLIQLLSDKGASLLLFPTLVIHPAPDLNRLKAEMHEQYNADWIIFISPNAVDHAMPLLISEYLLPKMTGQFATVGAGTRDSLASYGVNDIIYPLTEVGAQALLETLAHEQVAGKHVVIFKGDSENEMLEEGLKARGAIIHPIICYERKHSQDSPQPLVHALENGHMDIIVTTSGDGLKALVKLLPEFLHETLFKCPVVVVSERIREIATTLKFSNILLAKNASDEAIVAAIDKGAQHD